MIALLIPPEDKPQYARSTTFVDGLNQAAEAFTKRFRVVRPGMQRAHWADDATSLGNRVVLLHKLPQTMCFFFFDTFSGSNTIECGSDTVARGL